MRAILGNFQGLTGLTLSPVEVVGIPRSHTAAGEQIFSFHQCHQLVWGFGEESVDSNNNRKNNQSYPLQTFYTHCIVIHVCPFFTCNNLIS